MNLEQNFPIKKLQEGLELPVNFRFFNIYKAVLYSSKMASSATIPLFHPDAISSGGTNFVAISSVFAALSAAAAAARFLQRVWFEKIWWDDWLALASLVLDIGVLITMTLGYPWRCRLLYHNLQLVSIGRVPQGQPENDQTPHNMKTKADLVLYRSASQTTSCIT